MLIKKLYILIGSVIIFMICIVIYFLDNTPVVLDRYYFMEDYDKNGFTTNIRDQSIYDFALEHYNDYGIYMEQVSENKVMVFFNEQNTYSEKLVDATFSYLNKDLNINFTHQSAINEANTANPIVVITTSKRFEDIDMNINIESQYITK